MEVTQGYISKLERRDDMLVSNLYAYVEALGSQVEIRAKFANEEIKIGQFHELERLKKTLTPDGKGKKMDGLSEDILAFCGVIPLSAHDCFDSVLERQFARFANRDNS